MIRVNVVIQNKISLRNIKNPQKYLSKRIKILGNKISFLKKGKFDFTLLFSGNKRIKDLNKKYRKKNKISDILSFPFYEQKVLKNLMKKKDHIYLGDIIINVDKIKDKSNKKKFKLNFDKLWVHGLIHLFGYRHKMNKDFYKMKNLEDKFLNLIQ